MINIDPRMAKLVKNLKEIDAKRVIIEMEDKKIIIEDPQIMVLKQGGISFYTITGREKEEKKEEFSEEDIKLLIEKTGKTREEVIDALRKSNGDVLEAMEYLLEE